MRCLIIMLMILGSLLSVAGEHGRRVLPDAVPAWAGDEHAGECDGGAFHSGAVRWQGEPGPLHAAHGPGREDGAGGGAAGQC